MSILSDEIANDPLARGYAAMTDQQVADSLNAVNREIDKPVSLRELIVYLLKKGKWLAIEAESKTGTKAKAETAAFMVIMDNQNISDLDLTDPVVQGMLLSIKTAGLLNNADQTAILAMGKEMVSRAQELSIGRSRPGDVAKARAA